MQKPSVTIYDTTLRDGTQGTGISFSVVDKIRVAEKLDAFGVHYIEGGWPGSNPKGGGFLGGARGAQGKTRENHAFGNAGPGGGEGQRRPAGAVAPRCAH